MFIKLEFFSERLLVELFLLLLLVVVVVEVFIEEVSDVDGFLAGGMAACISILL
jgi:hypothetical protein